MRPIRSAALLMLLACSVCCEIGEKPLALGAKPKLVSRVPEDSEGLGCDYRQASCGVPANQPLSFEFDRWLLPSTATRQSLALWIDGANYSAFLQPEYDLLTRTVKYRVSGGLSAGLVYELTLADAASHDAGWGFRAYDLAPLERLGLVDPLVFRTGPIDDELDEEGAAETLPRRRCRDALEAFSSLGCTNAHCHESRQSTPAAGLGLDNAAELAQAIGRVAHATDRSGETGRVSVLPERFGLNMAIVDAGEPAFSFLLYRLLLRRDAYRNASGRFEVTPPADAELTLASTWFGAVGPMPPLSETFPMGTSPVEQARRLERWIRDGADTTDCD